MTGNELKSARLRLGLSQAQLAAALNMSGSTGNRTIRKWESGEYTIPGPVVAAIELLLEREE